MEHKTYNGWTNYETWCCNLWLDNDGMADEIAEWAQEAIDTAIENGKSDIRASATSELEDRIKSMVEEQAEEWMKDQASMFADLLNGALQEIDYREIASHYIDDIKLFSAGWNMPGYMPDSTPAVFTDFETARNYIAEEIERAADEKAQEIDYQEHDTEKSAITEYDDAKAWVKKQASEFSVVVGDYCYWVKEN